MSGEKPRVNSQSQGQGSSTLITEQEPEVSELSVLCTSEHKDDGHHQKREGKTVWTCHSFQGDQALVSAHLCKIFLQPLE